MSKNSYKDPNLLRSQVLNLGTNNIKCRAWTDLIASNLVLEEPPQPIDGILDARFNYLVLFDKLFALTTFCFSIHTVMCMSRDTNVYRHRDLQKPFCVNDATFV